MQVAPRANWLEEHVKHVIELLHVKQLLFSVLHAVKNYNKELKDYLTGANSIIIVSS